MVRIDPIPDDVALGEIFDEGYFVDGAERGGYADYDADAESHRRNARKRLAQLPDAPDVSGIDGPPVLVDVGCASGYVLEAARDKGWEAIGVEVVPEMADRARAKGFEVVPQLADVGKRVSALCMFQVLEHLPDPLQSLRQAGELAADGAVLLCETWDASSRIARVMGNRWQQLSPPSVMWVFERTSSDAMLQRAGWRLADWRRASKSISVGWGAGLVVARLPSPFARPARAVLRPLGGVRLTYGLGDLVAFSACRDVAR
ncbi:MAG: class I SAM-dependent methyltransferase [Ilumatobacteraceae bacterium]